MTNKNLPNSTCGGRTLKEKGQLADTYQDKLKKKDVHTRNFIGDLQLTTDASREKQSTLTWKYSESGAKQLKSQNLENMGLASESSAKNLTNELQ